MIKIIEKTFKNVPLPILMVATMSPIPGINDDKTSFVYNCPQENKLEIEIEIIKIGIAEKIK